MLPVLVLYLGCVKFFGLVTVTSEGMIWDDPWTVVAMQPGGTRLPPPRYPMAAGLHFRCLATDDIKAWIDLVGTRWTSEELVLRLDQAHIPCLFEDDILVGTCVLRLKANGLWILETLRARHGFGTPLLRAVIPWIYDRNGPFTLGYTWELSVPGLAAAWCRGWLSSLATIQYGYSWIRDPADCGFCPRTWEPIGPRLALPTLFQDCSGSAVVSDSGLGDGWGHVSVIRDTPCWTTIATKGGWRYLWTRSQVKPKGWNWTGEIVVVGLLNAFGHHSLDWVTAEIA